MPYVDILFIPHCVKEVNVFELIDFTCQLRTYTQLIYNHSILKGLELLEFILGLERHFYHIVYDGGGIWRVEEKIKGLDKPQYTL